MFETGGDTDLLGSYSPSDLFRFRFIINSILTDCLRPGGCRKYENICKLQNRPCEILVICQHKCQSDFECEHQNAFLKDKQLKNIWTLNISVTLVTGDSITCNIKLKNPATVMCIPGARAPDIEANLSERLTTLATLTLWYTLAQRHSRPQRRTWLRLVILPDRWVGIE